MPEMRELMQQLGSPVIGLLQKWVESRSIIWPFPASPDILCHYAPKNVVHCTIIAAQAYRHLCLRVSHCFLCIPVAPDPKKCAIVRQVC